MDFNTKTILTPDEELDQNNAGPAEDEEDDETSRCGVCCKPEDEDEDGNNSWIECDNCLIWYHVLCIPAGHEVSNGDDVRDENDMCLTGSAMFAHDKMCIPKCLVRVML